MITSQLSLAIQKRYALKAEQMYKMANVIANSLIKHLPSGNFQVASQSRPNQFHTINPRYESCTCEHAESGQMCFHLAAWKYTELATALRRAERDYRISEPKRDVTNQRELAARAKRDATKRVEWVEELDAA